MVRRTRILPSTEPGGRPGFAPRTRWPLLFASWLWFASAQAAPPASGADPAAAIASTRVEPQRTEPARIDAAQQLQQRLTEREDKRRPRVPITIQVGGRPLIVGGELELESATSWSRAADASSGRRVERALDAGLEVEAFHNFAPGWSWFAQARLAATRELRAGDRRRVSDRYLQRGEMWLYGEDLLGAGVDLELGRLNFEDDRRWWWDDQLDAIRLTFERGDAELALAAAQELAPSRSDRGFIDPEQDHVQRLIAEAAWDWSPNHALQVFALRQRDRSRIESPGQMVAHDREDPSDARLTWLGARATGVLDLRGAGLLGYWLDGARVRGDERAVEYEVATPRDSEVVAIRQRRVRGSAFDLGLDWLLPLAHEPRLFGGVAFGSGYGEHGIATDEGQAAALRLDRGFRQTGLQANESGFGGVQRFAGYGVLLDPELSNLRVQTLGAGMSLLRSSSLDVVYHRYRLDQPAESVRGARIELELDAAHRDLGSAIDVVVALEEWERFECFAALSGFHAGRAVLGARGQWDYAAFLAVRLAF